MLEFYLFRYFAPKRLRQWLAIYCASNDVIANQVGKKNSPFRVRLTQKVDEWEKSYPIQNWIAEYTSETNLTVTWCFVD